MSADVSFGVARNTTSAPLAMIASSEYGSHEGPVRPRSSGYGDAVGTAKQHVGRNGAYSEAAHAAAGDS